MDTAGTIYRFEVIYGSPDAFGQRYYLSSVRDVDSNTTILTYTPETNELPHLASISYNYLSSASWQDKAVTRVDFTYVAVAPPRITRAAGLGPAVIRNLSQVAVSTKNTTGQTRQLYHYELQYDTTSVANIHSLLVKIQQFGDAGASSLPLPATTFEYEQPGGQYALSSTPSQFGTSALPPSSPPIDAPYSQTAEWIDADADGRVDRVYQVGDRLWWARNTSTPGGAITFAPGQELAGSQGFILSRVDEIRVGARLLRSTTAGLLEVNGDGVPDLVLAQVQPSRLLVKLGQLSFDGSAQLLGVTYSYALNNSGQPDAAVSCFDTSFLPTPHLQYGDKEGFEDVNGDGLPDYWLKDDHDPNHVVTTVRLGYRRGGTSGCLWAFSPPYDKNQFTTYHSTGPGSTEARFTQAGAPTTRSYSSTNLPRVGVQTCSGYICPVDLPLEEPGEVLWDPRQSQALIDLNLDGHPDLVERHSDSSGGCTDSSSCAWSVWWGTGSGFVNSDVLIPHPAAACSQEFSFPEAYSSPDSDSCWCNNPLQPDHDFQMSFDAPATFSAWEASFQDVDGDGVPDWVINRSSSGSCGSNAGWSIYRGSASAALLRSVTLPTGAKYTVEYRRPDEFAGIARDKQRFVSRNLVWKLSLLASAPGETAIYHYYQDPVVGPNPYDANLLEPRGFSRTMVYESITQNGSSQGILRATTYFTNFSPILPSTALLAGTPTRVDVGTFAGSPPPPTAPPNMVAFNTVTSSYGACPRPSGGGPYYNGPYYLIAGEVTSYSEVAGALPSSLSSATFQSRQTTFCSDIDDSGNVLKVTRDPDVRTTGDEIIEFSKFDTSAACKSCPVEKSSYSGPGGSTPLALSVFRYDSPTGTWNQPLGPNQAGAGHLNFVTNTVWYGTVSWTERASATAYNADGTVAFKVMDPDAGTNSYAVTESYSYELGVRVTRTVRSDPSVSLTTDVAYDDWGRVVLQVGPYVTGSAAGAQQQAFGYDSASRLLGLGRSIDATGLVTGPLRAVTYDPNGKWRKDYTFLASRADFRVGTAPPATPDVRVVVSYLDEFGRTVEVRERLGGSGSALSSARVVSNLSGTRVVATRYDRMGRAEATLEPMFSTLSESVSEGFDSMAGKAGARGTLSRFDERGRLSCALSGVWSAVVADVSCTSSIAEGSGHHLAWSYGYAQDTSSRLATASVYPPRNTTNLVGAQFAYRLDGRLAWASDAYGNRTTYSYDIPGRSTTVTRRAAGQAGSAQAVTRYMDSRGRVVSETDDNLSPHFGPSRQYSYDALDRVVSAYLPGQLFGGVRVSPQMRHEYRSLGRKTRTFVYEPKATSGGVVSVSRDIATYAYDRPYANDASFGYTAGRISSVASPLTTTAFGYDQNGTITKRSQWFLGTTGAFITTRSASDDGRLLSSAFSTGYSKTLNWTLNYDSLGRAVQLDAGSSVRVWEAVSQGGTGAYDAFGRLQHFKTNAGYVSTEQVFEPTSNRLKSLVVRDQSMSPVKYFSMENATFKGTQLVSYTDASTQTNYTYSYDANARLKTAAASSAGVGLQQSYSESYSHSDSAWAEGATIGNLEKVTNITTLVTQEYDYSSDRVIARRPNTSALYPSPPSYVYDHAGRVTSVLAGNNEVEGYAYDVEDHLHEVRSSGTLTQTLEYGPEGEPLYRKVGTKVHFYVGESATVVADVPSGCTGYGGTNCTLSNVKVSVHISAISERVATVRVAGATGTDTASDVLYYHRDVRGSVVATTMTGGILGVKYRYGPYGAVDRKTFNTSSNACPAGQEARCESELGFTGGIKLTSHNTLTVYDGTLILLGARVYHVEMRRWLQPDTVDPQRYTYANGDPVNLIDPSGRLPLSDVARMISELPLPGGLLSTFLNPLGEMSALQETAAIIAMNAVAAWSAEINEAVKTFASLDDALKYTLVAGSGLVIGMSNDAATKPKDLHEANELWGAAADTLSRCSGSATCAQIVNSAASNGMRATAVVTISVAQDPDAVSRVDWHGQRNADLHRREDGSPGAGAVGNVQITWYLKGGAPVDHVMDLAHELLHYARGRDGAQLRPNTVTTPKGYSYRDNISEHSAIMRITDRIYDEIGGAKKGDWLLYRDDPNWYRDRAINQHVPEGSTVTPAP